MVVFDSSTIILLAKTELLDQFLSNYEEEIMIPEAVHKETCRSKKTFDALLIQKRIDEEQIKIQEVKNQEKTKKIQKDFNISKGEAEAIALAIQENVDILATDDKNAIKACKLLNISYTSAIQTLTRTYEKEVLTQKQAKIKLEKLIEHGRYSNKIIQEAKEVIGCKKP